MRHSEEEYGPGHTCCASRLSIPGGGCPKIGARREVEGTPRKSSGASEDQESRVKHGRQTWLSLSFDFPLPIHDEGAGEGGTPTQSLSGLL